MNPRAIGILRALAFFTHDKAHGYRLRARTRDKEVADDLLLALGGNVSSFKGEHTWELSSRTRIQTLYDDIADQLTRRQRRQWLQATGVMSKVRGVCSACQASPGEEHDPECYTLDPEAV